MMISCHCGLFHYKGRISHYIIPNIKIRLSWPPYFYIGNPRTDKTASSYRNKPQNKSHNNISYCMNLIFLCTNMNEYEMFTESFHLPSLSQPVSRLNNNWVLLNVSNVDALLLFLGANSVPLWHRPVWGSCSKLVQVMTLNRGVNFQRNLKKMQNSFFPALW